MDGNLALETKICRVCGDPFHRRPNEPPYQWRQRTTCGRGCGTKAGGMGARPVGLPGERASAEAYKAARYISERLGIPLSVGGLSFTATLSEEQVIEAARALGALSQMG